MSDPVGNLRYCFTPLVAYIADTPEQCLVVGVSPKASPVSIATYKDFGDANPHPQRTATKTLEEIKRACTEANPNNFEEFLKVFGYRSFAEGVSKLKQVTGHDHRAMQRYIIGAIAGAVPAKFLTAVATLLDFCYLAQMPHFDDNTLHRVEAALRAFHANKIAIITAGSRQGSRGRLDHWEVPKLKLLQHVVRSIRTSGAIMQWTADVTEHAHVTEIKNPVCSGNNQDYYSQIARHLDRKGSEEEDEDEEDGHEPDAEALHILHYYSPILTVIDYFKMAKEVASGTIPDAVLPHRIFASSTTAFRLATKPSLWTTIDEASEKYGLADLRLAITDYFRCVDRTTQATLATDGMQIWFKAPQSLLTSPPSPRLPNGRYDFAIISETDESDWPSNGLRGHSVVQVHLIFQLLRSNVFLAYIQRLNATIPSSNTFDSAAGMHVLKRAIRNNGTRAGEVIPLRYICSPAHVIPRFRKEANSRLTAHTSYELSNEFWLNKYWNKEFFYALSLSTIT
ncbi:hypothetical protein SCLCIDRAFT_34549 [Scleroderma citrinum Foug A]|uniref:DUF6830 domain-containing protein n=1 Tax=Scleroderma citrinum Foug A TaxID=1036808 RepID=A0A0C2ZAT4_9AGAM|nr:hypothetical protein SCLCIDRAFT_34549 [Scleroderma citrinum Foug A]